MILILSNNDDQSTSDVINWLLKFNTHFVRINQNDGIDIEVAISKNELDIIVTKDDCSFRFSEITSYWYRRGNFNNTKYFEEKKSELNYEINTFVNKEFYKLVEYCHLYLTETKSLGSYIENRINKLYVLKSALKFGINVPDTYIVSEKLQIKKLAKKHKLITKAIGEGFSYRSGEEDTIEQYTQEVTPAMISNLPLKFNPMLVQQKLAKAYELRIFYLDKTFYSSAIFSQTNEKTKVDFRHYDKEWPNRVIPYSLAKPIEKKLIKLMAFLDYKTGSIDIVIDKNGNHFFLEVNPIGQFQQVSKPCNYNIEEKIAKFLING